MDLDDVLRSAPWYVQLLITLVVMAASVGLIVGMCLLTAQVIH